MMQQAHAPNELWTWLLPGWEWLNQGLASGRVPPALLIQGPDGLGKTRLARVWAQKLLCKVPQQSGPCGMCPSCLLFAAGNHPDYEVVEPLESGKTIGVDSIRQLIHKLSLKPQYNGYRIVVIEPAHLLNLNAANALLKTLEEPSPYTLIILITSASHKLPVTLLSRCQKLTLSRPDQQQALDWLRARAVRQDPLSLLNMAGGSPLAALALDATDHLQKRDRILRELLELREGKRDPVHLAGQWEPLFNEALIGWIMTGVNQWIRLKLGLPATNREDTLCSKLPVESLSLEALFGYWDLLLKTRQYLSHNLNTRLVVEELLIRWQTLA